MLYMLKGQEERNYHAKLRDNHSIINLNHLSEYLIALNSKH